MKHSTNGRNTNSTRLTWKDENPKDYLYHRSRAIKRLREEAEKENTKKYYTRVTSTLREGETLVQNGFELVGNDGSGCLWRKPKTFEDVIKERERELSVKSEF